MSPALDKFTSNIQNFANESKLNIIMSCRDIDQYCRNELAHKDQNFHLVLFGVPLVVSILCHMLAYHDFMILRLDVVIYAFLASILTVAHRDNGLEKKFITSLVILNIFRLIADASALKIIILALIPWISETIIEELLGMDLKNKDKSNDEKKNLIDEEAERKRKITEEAEKKHKAAEDDKKIQIENEKAIAQKQQQLEEKRKADELAAEKTRAEERSKKQKADIDAAAAEEAAEALKLHCSLISPVEEKSLPLEQPITPPPPKPTKQYIQERKTASHDYRQTMDIKGDRAYTYLIKKFHQHQNGTFFERDFHFTKKETDDLLLKNQEILLSHEATHQIWTHEYSTGFNFVFPDDLNPKGKDIKWEIDTFLLYSALSRILQFGDETQIIFKHYNTINTFSQKSLVIEGGEEGVKIVILPGENQAYLVRYTLQIQYKFDAKENCYVDSIDSKGLVSLKITPYIALKDVMKALPDKVASNRASTRVSISNPNSKA